MGNLIAGLVAVVLVTSFLGFMAFKIGSVPFGVIVVAILIMVFVDFVQTLRKDRSP